jgi:hypothetical protein
MDLWELLYPRDERRQPLANVLWWVLTVAAGLFLALTPFIRERIYPPFGQRYPGQHVPHTPEGKPVMGVGLFVLVIGLGWFWRPRRPRRK